MALPKEPRQKMINMMYLVLTALLALNVSSEILNAFKVVDASLRTSNDNIAAANGTLYKSLSDKLADPQSAEKAKLWQPKAEAAHKLSDDMYNYIDNLKMDLKKEADLKMVDGKEQFREDNLDAATRLFDTKGKGKDLEQKLKDYKEAMLNIDPEIRKQFEASLPVEVTPPVAQDGTKKDFTTSFFHMTPTVAALTILSKFENNVKNSENQVVTYCHNQIGAVKVIYDQFAALVGQSSNYVMPGEEVEITAGVGAYSKAAQPTITINGTVASLDADGRASAKFPANGGGAHSVPVNVTYTKPDGTKESKSFDVKYTVGTPGGAAVMLDKMNVFYVGVENPVTIGSPTGWDKTTVSMTGGEISGSGSSRVVKVTNPGKAVINVTANGKTTAFDFRVKNIPDPIIKVGPSAGGKMQSIIFKSQPFVRADLENFDFKANFSVTGATIYFTGPQFRNTVSVNLTSGSLAPAQQYLSMCGPGSAVIFDNIKVVGPDGKPRTIQNPPGFSLF